MLRKSVPVKLFVALIFSLITGYFLTSALQVLINKTNMQDNLLNYEGVYLFFLETTAQNKMIISTLTVLVFSLMFSQLNKKAKEFEDASAYGVHGSARFTEVHEIVDGNVLSRKNKYRNKNPLRALQVEDGLIIGKVPSKNELLILPRETEVDNRNVLVVGSAGSGKGQAFVLNNLINNNKETIIVTDPKGELYDFTHKIKRDQGYKVYQIDFIDLENGGYNPLSYVKDDQDAQQIAKIIAKNSAKDGKEDFFQVEGQRLLTALIIYCKEEFPNANIPDHVFDMFNSIAKDENYLDEILADMNPSHPAYMQLRSVTVAEGRTRSSILASFTQQTGIFAINKVANLTRECTFDFREFQEQKSILYVKLPMEDNPFLALTATFFDQLISVFYNMASQNNSVLKLPTIFMLDEFANIGKIEKYGTVLSTCRGLGISMNTIVQDFAQLEEMYGKEVTRTILNNHDITIYLRTKDTETAKYFSEISGDTTAKLDTDSTSTQGGIFSSKHSSSRSNQEQYVQRKLIDLNELINIDRDISYVYIAGYHPFKAEKAWQFNLYDDLLDNYGKYKGKIQDFYGKDRTNKGNNEIAKVEQEKIIERPQKGSKQKKEFHNEEHEEQQTIDLHANEDEYEGEFNDGILADSLRRKNQSADEINKQKTAIEYADDYVELMNVETSDYEGVNEQQ